jgi:hypothetical protein
VIDSVVLRKTGINQAVVAAPAIRMDDHIRLDATANNGLQSFISLGDFLRMSHSCAAVRADAGKAKVMFYNLRQHGKAISTSSAT